MSKIKYGLSNVAVAKRTEARTDGVTTGGVTYATPVKLPGAVNFSVDKEQSEITFYADNILYYNAKAKTSEGGDLELADIPRQILLDYLGYKEAKEGGILETNSLDLANCALMFQVETDGKARKFIYYNCTLAESSEEYATVDGDITPQTSTISVTCAGETVGDRQVFKRVLEVDDEGYETAFTTVTVPSFKTE